MTTTNTATELTPQEIIDQYDVGDADGNGAGDGIISREEFQNYMNENFQNADGTPQYTSNQVDIAYGQLATMDEDGDSAVMSTDEFVTFATSEDSSALDGAVFSELMFKEMMDSLKKHLTETKKILAQEQLLIGCQ